MKPPPNLVLTQRKYQRWSLVALLAVLHLSLLVGDDTALSLTCWIVDLGLFILWQPYIHAQRKLDTRGLGAVLFSLSAGVWLFGWWLLVFWVTALAALVGGRVMFVEHRPTRIFYLTAFAYLLTALLVFLMPRVVAEAVQNASLLEPVLDQAFVWGMPFSLLFMLFLPIRQEPERPGEGIVDFFYSLFIFLLIAVLVLGSLAFMLLRQATYINAVFQTSLSMALMLFLIAWAWNPRPGFSGFGVFFSRYLLSIGLPFERWLHRLTAYSSSENDPERFLNRSLEEMLALPWIEGGAWQANERSGDFGEARKAKSFTQTFFNEPLQLTLYTRHQLSPALVWHFHLLAQLTNEYYLAKKRARELQQVGYLRAVYETGARLTHDVKNLLQSLNNLCYLAEQSKPEAGITEHDGQLTALLRRQLPQMTQRLQQTLNKLQKPLHESEQPILASEWWRLLEERYRAQALIFEALDADLAAYLPIYLPAALFDSVADNLLQNALTKRQHEAGLQIRVRLRLVAGKAALCVCDSGTQLSEDLLADLLRAPVASQNGLGIGLYHAAQQALEQGYELCLTHNALAQVCFELRPGEKPSAND
ncbi:MAG: sensor histidine kinase [Pseudomonadota bacterium]